MLQTHTPGAAPERGALRPRARGHVEDVFCCALSPDGQQVARGVDRTIRLWDADGRHGSGAARVLTPFYAYLICYRVLEASGDGRAASLLQRAERRLRECAEHITDDALRRSFLENVAAHLTILTMAHTTAPPDGVR